uniref:mRNA-decapping enzyme-like protein n=1 Tax=Kalanchoe fedtschenkoi TaxID=63787 RepID=A0A7N0SWY9_KALFE
MSRTGKLKPNLDQHTLKLFNLTVLQRIDPFIDEILYTAAHVTFYEFDINTDQWSRKDVEGSLFVVKRNTQPRFQFIVMNRRSADNLVENLLGDFEFEVQLPYILYTNASQEVNGVWFYNSRDCEEVANLFNRILSAYSKVSTKPQISSTKSEFEELEKVPTMAEMDGPLEPLPATSTRADGMDDTPFVNFFSSAMNIGNKPTLVNQKENYQAISNPPSHALSFAPYPDNIQSQPVVYSSATDLPIIGSVNTIRSSNSVTNLVKPSSFFQPSSASSGLMTPSTSSAAVGSVSSPFIRSHQFNGAPAVQPFPPPTSQISHAYNSSSQSLGRDIDRDKVRDALLMLAKDEQFIDIVYQAILKAHNT